MAAAETGTGAPDGGPVLGRLSDFPAGAAAPAGYRRAGGREVAVLVVRRGAGLRAYLDLCPRQYLPLTWRGRRVLSADGERLRCSNHGAEFAVGDGLRGFGAGGRVRLDARAAARGPGRDRVRGQRRRAGVRAGLSGPRPERRTRRRHP
ncbi:hypothetical protein GCM10009416_30580 [Craurococcus roseus]|uniref:Rieske domain-containing protein n=1 Tax=Craurococcus roseus TaxID=77585 RepID=A0ABN1FFW4_9PROT